MKKLTGKILLALSFCMLSFLVPHSFSQAKVMNFDIYNGDMPGDLENYYDEEKEYVDEEDLYFPGDSGKIKWVSTNKKVVTVSSKGVIKAKKKTGNTVVYAQIGEHRLGCAVSVVSSKKKKVINRAKKIYKTCKYSQPLRMNSKYYDCSSLVWKSYRLMGKTFGNRNYAPVAADIAKWCAGKKKMVKGGVSEKNITKMKLRPATMGMPTVPNWWGGPETETF